MPVHSCQEDGKPGYQWGGKGKCYTYTPNNEESRKRAHAKAELQGRAARSGGYSGAETHSGIQSLRFSKKKFNKSQAIAWAKSHNFKSGDVEEMPNEWRLRQFSPNLCTKSGGMKDLASGVRGYICPTTGVSPGKSFDSLFDSLNRISNSLNKLREML